MADQITGLLSPFLRSRRIAAVRPFLGDGYVLDIGCGTGELARDVDPAKYLGVDRDEETVAIARKRFPSHEFKTVAEFSSTQNETRFDQIIGLAIIEHVDDPKEWLSWLRTFLKPGGRVILTTPHPSTQSVHELGASIGLFSREGAKEHRELIDRCRMSELATATCFRIGDFRRFLWGCNQLFALEPS
jgi:2-polyprenyl-3-methyl-5-hydroxy-6-metoxy-1,4-benzoquinol methylase